MYLSLPQAALILLMGACAQDPTYVSSPFGDSSTQGPGGFPEVPNNAVFQDMNQQVDNTYMPGSHLHIVKVNKLASPALKAVDDNGYADIPADVFMNTRTVLMYENITSAALGASQEEAKRLCTLETEDLKGKYWSKTGLVFNLQPVLNKAGVKISSPLTINDFPEHTFMVIYAVKQLRIVASNGNTGRAYDAYRYCHSELYKANATNNWSLSREADFYARSI